MSQYTKEKDGITFHYLDEACKILHNEDGVAILWHSSNTGHHYLYNKYVTEKRISTMEGWKRK